MASYESLEVFQRADRLVIVVYSLTKKFPKEEMYGLTSQIRRAMLSISINIVEGYTRNSTREFIQFLNIAKGSAAEVKYEIELSQKLGYSSQQESTDITTELVIIIKMLTKLIQSLSRSAS